MIHPEVPKPIVDRVRAVCLALPGVTEEPAWIGVRWKVAGKTFAHLLTIFGGKPPAFAKAAGSDGPLVVLMVRGALPPPPGCFAALWGRTLIGISLRASTPFNALVRESHRLLARAPRASGAARSAAAPRPARRSPRRARR